MDGDMTAQAPMSYNDSGDTESLWSYINVLLRRRYLLVVVPILFGLVTGILTLRSQRLYMSTTSFVPSDPVATSGLGVGLGELAAQFGVVGQTATSGGMRSPQFYADLLHSREVLLEVINTSYERDESGGTRITLFEYFGIDANDGTSAMLRAMRELGGLAAVRVNGATGVVTLEVTTTISVLSDQIALKFLELVNDYNLVRRQSQAQAEREFVERRLVTAESALVAVEDKLADFYTRNRSFGSPDLMAAEARIQRQVAIQQQLYLTLAQGFEKAKIDEVRNTPVVTVLERPMGLVEPLARNTVRKVMLAHIFGFVAALVLVIIAEFVNTSRVGGSKAYGEFTALRREVFADVRRRLWLELRRRKRLGLS